MGAGEELNRREVPGTVRVGLEGRRTNDDGEGEARGQNQNSILYGALTWVGGSGRHQEIFDAPDLDLFRTFFR